jgi:pilus assembly protein Flp/PilA
MNPKIHSISSSRLVIWFTGRFSAAKKTKGDFKMKNWISILRDLKNTAGQDLIEYALMAGFVAVAAGAVMPGVADSISSIFSQVGSVIDVASTQGS